MASLFYNCSNFIKDSKSAGLKTDEGLCVPLSTNQYMEQTTTREEC